MSQKERMQDNEDDFHVVFSTEDKARTYIEKTDLAETHEAILEQGGWWHVRPRQ